MIFIVHILSILTIDCTRNPNFLTKIESPQMAFNGSFYWGYFVPFLRGPNRFVDIWVVSRGDA